MKQLCPHYCTNDVFILDDDKVIIVIASEGFEHDVISRRSEFDYFDGLIHGVTWVFNNDYVYAMGNPIRDPKTGKPHKIGVMRALHVLEQQSLRSKGLLEAGGPRYDRGLVFKPGPAGRLDVRPNNRIVVKGRTKDKAFPIIAHYQRYLGEGMTSEQITEQLEHIAKSHRHDGDDE